MSFRHDIDGEFESKETRLAKAKEMVRLASDLGVPDHVRVRLENELKKAYKDIGYYEGSLGGFRDEFGENDEDMDDYDDGHLWGGPSRY